MMTIQISSWVPLHLNITKKNSGTILFVLLELEIKTLQNTPSDADNLRRLLQKKQRQKEEDMHIQDTQRLVTAEIEMSLYVFYKILDLYFIDHRYRLSPHLSYIAAYVNGHLCH
jgi:hypothetical protein